MKIFSVSNNPTGGPESSDSEHRLHMLSPDEKQLSTASCQFFVDSPTVDCFVKELASGSFAGNWFFSFFLGNDVTGSLKKKEGKPKIFPVFWLCGHCFHKIIIYLFMFCLPVLGVGSINGVLQFLMLLMIVSWFLDVWVWVKNKEFKVLVTVKFFNANNGV